jgi:hypothetical protein
MNTLFNKRFLIAGSILILMLAAGPISAARVDLDGILNSGFSANMPNSYLFVKSLGPPETYAYKWNYGDGTLPWASRQALVDDLADGTLNNAPGQPSVGSWRVEAGGYPFDSLSQLPIWKSIGLGPGTYALKLTSDSRAYNLSDYAWPGETSPPVPNWNAYVQIYADYGGGPNASFNFGEAPAFIKPTEAQALAFYRNNVDGKQIQLTQAANVFFYINDNNSIDNAGGVSLEIQSVPVPQAVYLLGSGLLGLALIRRRFRN